MFSFTVNHYAQTYLTHYAGAWCINFGPVHNLYAYDLTQTHWNFAVCVTILVSASVQRQQKFMTRVNRCFARPKLFAVCAEQFDVNHYLHSSVICLTAVLANGMAPWPEILVWSPLVDTLWSCIVTLWDSATKLTLTVTHQSWPPYTLNLKCGFFSCY